MRLRGEPSRKKRGDEPASIFGGETWGVEEIFVQGGERKGKKETTSTIAPPKKEPRFRESREEKIIRTPEEKEKADQHGFMKEPSR